MGRILIFIFVMLAIGCSETENQVPQDKPIFSVTGVGYDGLIMDGFVDFYSYDSRSLIASTVTDGEGHYDVTFQITPTELMAELSGGRYIEEASSNDVPLKESESHMLRAVYSTIDINSSPINITTWTNVAAGLAEFYIKKKNIKTKEAIDTANRLISDFIGFQILNTTPVDTTKDNKAVNLTDGFKYGFLSSGVSQLTYDISSNYETIPHRNINSINFSVMAYDDISFDGKLDGVDQNGPITFGRESINANTYRHKIALSILKYATNVNNKTGLTVKDIYNYAETINDSNSVIFGDAGVIPIDEGGSILASVNPAANSLVSGSINLNASIIDAIGVGQVDMYINGVYSATASDPNNISIALDSYAYSDGPVQLKFHVTNLAGGVSDINFNYQVDNERYAYLYNTVVSSNTSYIVKYATGSGEPSVVVANSEIVKAVSNDNMKALAYSGGRLNWYDMDEDNGALSNPIDSGVLFDSYDVYVKNGLLVARFLPGDCSSVWPCYLKTYNNPGSITLYGIGTDYHLNLINNIDESNAGSSIIPINKSNNLYITYPFKAPPYNINLMSFNGNGIVSTKSLTGPAGISDIAEDSVNGNYYLINGGTTLSQYKFNGTDLVPYKSYTLDGAIQDVYFSEKRKKLYAMFTTSSLNNYLAVYDADPVTGSLTEAANGPYYINVKLAVVTNSSSTPSVSKFYFDYDDKNIIIIGKSIGAIIVNLLEDGTAGTSYKLVGGISEVKPVLTVGKRNAT